MKRIWVLGKFQNVTVTEGPEKKSGGKTSRINPHKTLLFGRVFWKSRWIAQAPVQFCLYPFLAIPKAPSGRPLEGHFVALIPCSGIPSIWANYYYFLNLKDFGHFGWIPLRFTHPFGVTNRLFGSMLTRGTDESSRLQDIGIATAPANLDGRLYHAALVWCLGAYQKCIVTYYEFVVIPNLTHHT